VGLALGHCITRSDCQVVHTHVPLSACSIIWSKGGDAEGNQGRVAESNDIITCGLTALRPGSAPAPVYESKVSLLLLEECYNCVMLSMWC